MRKQRNIHSEHGIALLVVLFALILVSAIGLAMMFSTNGESEVASGFRQNNLAYFAARAGLEEVRDRIRSNSPANLTLPTVPIGQANGVLYVLNPRNGEVVAPWDPANPYFDDEICHEVNSPLIIAGSPGTLGAPCPAAATSIPVGTTWYVQPAPASQPMPGGQVLSYKWTRINLKMNEGAQPWCVLGNGNCGHLPYSPYLPGGPRADQVCYNGSNEFVLSDVRTPIEVPGFTERASLPSQLAMAMTMFAGGSTGNGNSSHSSATTTSGSSTAGSSSTSSTSTTGVAGTGTSSSSSSTAGSSSSSTSSSSTSSSSTSSSSSSTGLIGTGTSSSSSSSSTGLIGTGSSSSSSTGLIGTGSTSSSTTGSSSSSSSSSGSSSTSGSTSTTGTPPPACGTAAPPLAGTPIGVGAGPMSANQCSDLDSQPVYMLTSLAVAPSSTAPNKATRMIQYEVAKVAIPPMPAALTVAGHDPVISGLPNSNNLTMNGNDSCGGPAVPAIGATTDVGIGGLSATDEATAARNAVISQIPNNRYGNYTGADPCGGTQPDVQNVINTANTMYSTPQGLNAIVQDVQNVATQTFSGDYTGIPNLGTNGNPQVTVIDGNLTLSGDVSGNGILLVTGTLTYKGNFSFNGLILVVGAGVLQASGGGTGNFTGGVVVAQIGDNSGCAAGTSPCYTKNPTDANLLPHLGVPTVGWNGGGTNSLQFNSCSIQLGMNSASFAVIARREIIY